MINFKKMLLLSVFALSACAEPKYVSENALTPTAASVSNCEWKFSSSQICVSYKWLVPPSEEQPGEALVRLYRLDSGDEFPFLIEDDVKLRVQLFMPFMGHGSAPTRTVKLQQGTYQVSRMYFTMTGEWTINFQILNDEGAIHEEVVVPFTL